MPEEYFFRSLGRTTTFAKARYEAGEYARDAHDLCCWPIQAAKPRAISRAIFQELADIEKMLMYAG